MTPTSTEQHRFHFLDGLRGLAALAVVAWHFPPNMRNAMPVSGGFLAVDFFFCLSGFVIAFSYETRLLKSLSVGKFLLARLIRLYPLYVIGSVLGLLVAAVIFRSVPVAGGQQNFLLLIPMAILLIPTGLFRVAAAANFPFDPPAWSLFFELVANVFYAPLVKLRLVKVWLLAPLMALALASLIHTALHSSLNEGSTASSLFPTFARIGYSFPAGVLVYRMWSATRSRSFSSAARWSMAIIGLGGLLLVLWSPFQAMHSVAFQIAAIVLIFPVIVYVGCFVRFGDGANRVSSALGDASYPLYILHDVVLFPLFGAHLQSFTSAHRWALLGLPPLIIAGLTAASYFAGATIDAPLRRVLSRKLIRKS